MIVAETSPFPKVFPAEQLQRRHQVLDTLAEAYSQRKDQYRVCIVEGLLREVGGTWLPHTLLLRFWHEPTGRPNVTFDYPAGARLVRSELSASSGWDLVTRLRDNLSVEIEGVGQLQVGEQTGLIEENDSHLSPPAVGWRCLHLTFYTGGSISTMRNDVFVSPDAPLYPDSEKAVLAWTGTHAHWGIGRDDKLTIILPEFACRISGLRLGREETDVVVEPGPTPPERVRGQYFAMADGQPIVTGKFEGPPGPFTVHTGFVPDLFEVNVFDPDSKRLLDGRSFRRGQVYGSQGVSWREKEEDLRAAILGGEGEFLEFKEAWNGDNPLRFKEAVTALANSTSGGTIVFGVKNSPIEIVGVKEAWNLDEWRVTLGNTVRDSINPIPHIEVSEEQVPERLILVQVAPGDRPPYLLRNRGVLIRTGSNNRVPEQYELVELVKRGLPQRPVHGPGTDPALTSASRILATSWMSRSASSKVTHNRFQPSPRGMPAWARPDGLIQIGNHVVVPASCKVRAVVAIFLDAIHGGDRPHVQLGLTRNLRYHVLQTDSHGGSGSLLWRGEAQCPAGLRGSIQAGITGRFEGPATDNRCRGACTGLVG